MSYNFNLKERLHQMTRRMWIRFAVETLLLLLFTLWVGSAWLLLLLPLLVDVRITRLLPWGFWKKWNNPLLRKTMEWVDAILYALVAVYLINTFFFQNYKIPTSSLEKSLLVGDYLLVSKLSYGARVPNTPLSFPLAQHTMPILGTKSYLENPQWGYKRLAGTGVLDRGEIAVFNFPAGDSVTANVQNPDYYTLAFSEGAANFRQDTTGMNLSNYEFITLVRDLGRSIIKRQKSQGYGELLYRPVDRRENYVKRTIGMPGETLQIINNDVYVDGKKLERPEMMQLNYTVETNGTRFGEQNFRDMDISLDDRVMLYQGGDRVVYQFPLTAASLEQVKKYPFVTRVTKEGDNRGEVFPLGLNKGWTRSNYGPIWIPKRGEIVELTLDNLLIYEQAIRNYERNTLEVKEGEIYINGKKSNSYTFQMDYYMMFGDNRDKSADSRYWGFVPEDHIVGKPLFVWLSIDKDRSWLDGRIRFNRLFKGVGSK